jgi:thiol:disulfide interchange protein DsbD
MMALMTALCPSLRAQPGPTLSLVSEVRSIQPGVPFYVGLSIHLGPGYHTYWKFPGIAGVAASIQWKLPDGFEAGPIEWPEPERVFMLQVKCQGFERDVILPVKITPPTGLVPGRSVKIGGTAAWLHCTQACQVSVDSVAIELPVRSEIPAYDPQWRPKFEAERLRFAQPSDSWIATAAENGRTVTLTLSPAAATARRLSDQAEAEKLIFFTDDGWIDSDKPQIVKLVEDGTLAITLIRSEVYLQDRPPATLSGLVRNPAGWLAGGKLRSLQIGPVLKR